MGENDSKTKPKHIDVAQKRQEAVAEMMLWGATELSIRVRELREQRISLEKENVDVKAAAKQALAALPTRKDGEKAYEIYKRQVVADSCKESIMNNFQSIAKRAGQALEKELKVFECTSVNAREAALVANSYYSTQDGFVSFPTDIEEVRRAAGLD